MKSPAGVIGDGGGRVCCCGDPTLDAARAGRDGVVLFVAVGASGSSATSSFWGCKGGATSESTVSGTGGKEGLERVGCSNKQLKSRKSKFLVLSLLRYY